MGLTLILITGILCLVMGIWIIPKDLRKVQALFSRRDGWIFTIPVVLAVADVYLTLLGLSRGSRELNPYVSSAVQIGPWAVVPFLVAYIALSEGLAVAILTVGSWMFGTDRALRYIPFALVCGAASVGPLNNILFLTSLAAAPMIYFVALVIGVIAMPVGIFLHFGRTSR